LLRRAVLGFVEDDEAVIEGAAAHEGQRRDLDGRSFEELLYFFSFQHVVEGVVQRAEVGIHLFLQGAGEKSEALAGFDGRASQNDTADALANERLNGHGYREVGFAGSGGADAEDEVVALDRFEIAALRNGFGREDLFPETALAAAGDERAKRDFRIRGDDAQEAVEIAVFKDGALLHERKIVFENAFGAGDVGRLALDLEGVVSEFGTDVQTGFDESDIFVPGAEEAFDASANLHTGFHLVRG